MDRIHKNQKIIVYLVLIFVLGLVLRVGFMLTLKSVWLDEAFVVLTSRSSWIDLLKGNYWDFPSHPFLPYLIVKLWSYVSLSERWLRIPYIIASLGTIIVTYFLALELFGRKKLALIAAFLLAISTYSVRFAIEIKFYSISLLFQTLSLLYFIKIIKHFRHEVRFHVPTLFVLFSFLALVTDYGMFWLLIVYLLVSFIELARLKRSKQLSEVLPLISLICALAVFDLFFPWLVKFVNSLSIAFDLRTYYVFKPNLSDIIKTLLGYLTYFKNAYDYYSAPYYFYSIVIKTINAIYIYGSICLGVIIIIYQIIRNIMNRRVTNYLLSFVIFVPLLLSFIISQFKESIFVHYNFMIVQIGLLLVLADLAMRSYKLFYLLIVLYLAVNSYSYFFMMKGSWDDWRQIYGYINSQQLTQNSAVIFYPDYYSEIISYYSLVKKEILSFQIIEIPFDNNLLYVKTLLDELNKYDKICYLSYMPEGDVMDKEIVLYLSNMRSVAGELLLTSDHKLICYF